MIGLLQDLKLAVRTLTKSPLFAIMAVLSLALGIGANTAIFTLLDQLLLRLLPVRDPQQLVMIWSTGPHMGNNRGSRASSYPMYQDYAQKAEAFSSVFCRLYSPMSISFNGQTERVNAELVSGNYFQALGVGPAVGRVFSPEEDDRVYKGHPSVVLGYDYWVTRFGRDPKVVGQKVLVNNYPMTIVGVSAPGFAGIDPTTSAQIRVPIQMKPLMTPGWDDLGNRRSQWINLFARMKPGFTIESAQASLQPLFHSILEFEITQKEFKDTSKYNRDEFLRRTVKMVPAATGYSEMREMFSSALWVLMAMVGLVLLIACFNAANLLIARAATRQKEIGVRLALGATRAQLVRQLLIESLLLSVLAAAAGLLLSYWTTRALLSLIPTDEVALTLRATPDYRILAFNIALSVLTAVLFGLVPALHATRFDLWSTLKDAAGAVAGAKDSVSLRKVLVTAQVALSFLLLAGAGLFVRSLGNLKATSTGFRDIDNLITFQIDPALNGYNVPRLKILYKQLIDNVRAIPGVSSAAYVAVPVLSGGEWDSTMSVEGHQAKDGEDLQAFMNAVSPQYWKTMGVQLVEGRDFDARDEGEKAKVAIVNRKFAGHFFGKQSPVGRHIGFGSGPGTKLDIEIVGMVEDSLYEGPRDGVHRQAFIASLEGDFPGGATFYVRTTRDSGTVYAALRREVAKLDATIPVYGMKTLANQLDENLATERLIAMLSAAFGALATLLAAIGLYGVMAFVVARRTKEIGVRMALGAPRGAVLWMVMREVLLLLACGLAIGVPCAYVLSRYASTLLYGVKPADLWTGLAALVTLTVVTAAAGFLPAQRASAIDPMRALRYE